MARTCLAASTGCSTIFVALGLVWLRGSGPQWKCEIQEQGESHWKLNTLSKAHQNHNKMAEAETLPHNLVATTSVCKNYEDKAVQKMKAPDPTPTQMVGAWLFACWDPWCPIVRTHEIWIASIDVRPTIRVPFHTYKETAPECKFVGLFRHLGNHQIYFLKNIGTDMFPFDKRLTLFLGLVWSCANSLDSAWFAILCFNFQDCLEAANFKNNSR